MKLKDETAISVMRLGVGTRSWRPLRRLFVVVAAGAMLAAPQLSLAAQLLSVDFTVHETIPVTHGTIIAGHLEGCAKATMRTIRADSSQSGGVMTFSGSKKIYCGSGDSLTLAFKVTTSKCQKTDSGTWKVTRGTGLFASAHG